MFLGFTVSAKMIQLQDQLGIDIVHYAGDLCYAGLSGDLTPFNNVTEDDEFGHVCVVWCGMSVFVTDCVGIDLGLMGHSE